MIWELIKRRRNELLVVEAVRRKRGPTPPIQGLHITAHRNAELRAKTDQKIKGRAADECEGHEGKAGAGVCVSKPQKGKMPSYTLVEGIFDPYYEYNLN